MDRRAAKVLCSRTREELRRMENSPMEPWQALESATIDRPASTFEQPVRPAPSHAPHPDLYHPSSLLRRALDKRLRQQPAKAPGEQPSPGPEHAPPLSSLLGAALAVGAASGFLEMAVQAVQLHLFHRVDWSSLMFNRHAVLAGRRGIDSDDGISHRSCSSPRCSSGPRGGSSRGKGIAREFVDVGSRRDALLGTLLLLGPLQAIHGFHPAAPLAVASAPAFQLKRLLVRRSPGWQRISRFLGVAVILLLPAYVWWQWHRVTSVPRHAWSRPGQSSPNLIWIVLDTLRADHLSLYGYHRQTTPPARRLGETGHHVRHGALGRPVDPAFPRDDVHRPLAKRARRAGRPALLTGARRHWPSTCAIPAMPPAPSWPTCGCAITSTASRVDSTRTSTIPGTRRSRSRRR